MPSVFSNKVFLLKKRLQYGFFSVNFVKFLRTAFFTEHLLWLLLIILAMREYFPQNGLHTISYMILKMWDLVRKEMKQVTTLNESKVRKLSLPTL